MSKKQILFYASVRDKSLFQIQRFYAIDILLLENLGYRVYLTNKLWPFLQIWKYNSAFIYFYKYGFFAGVVARIFFKKVFFTGGIDELERSVNTKKKYFLQVLFFRLCYFVANQCIIVSRADWDNIQNIYKGRLSRKLFLSQHTIEVCQFDTSIESKENLCSMIGWMGVKDNVVRKGMDTALKLFAFLVNQSEFLNYKLIIIGETGEGAEYLKSLCCDLKIEKYVKFTGAITEVDKINILKRSKIYFQLSIYEGFGIAALEALAARNIVIHSGNGGLKDTIRDYGIKVDLEKREEDWFISAYQQLCKYDYLKFDTLSEYLNENFSNASRQKDFSKILESSDIKNNSK